MSASASSKPTGCSASPCTSVHLPLRSGSTKTAAVFKKMASASAVASEGSASMKVRRRASVSARVPSDFCSPVASSVTDRQPVALRGSEACAGAFTTEW
ncbi:hypothetical protein D9M69_610600 [compost metagenome]